ncbi:MAG: phytanoyl-CoA dioxygenase family protein [Nevskia sp.]|nr:phytanoyl-CoA dioxygenase family protein [Nevskia sp.]
MSAAPATPGRRLRQAALLPLHLLALASGAKSFRDNPLIGSRLLNRAGLHAARVLLAHGVMRLRRLWFAAALSREERHAFARDGYFVRRDFLPPERFAALERELRAERAATRNEIQGDTLTRSTVLDNALLRQLPACRAVLRDPAYLRLARYAAGRARVPFHWIQQLRRGVVEGAVDPQSVLHADTFHPTMKAWLFVDDVGAHNGAFTYVPGSHRLTRARLGWEYRQSLIGADQPVYYAGRGSLRIEAAELPGLGLPPPLQLAVPRNTLVVADTHGFHCRGPAPAGGERLELFAISRTNPFNPLPGLPFAALDWLDRAGLRVFLRLRERARARRST